MRSISSEARKKILESISVKRDILSNDLILNQLEKLIHLSVQALKAGGKIIFSGNGGSFADAQHLSAELISRFQYDRSPLPSIALGTNSSTMSAIGNDYGHVQVFARELQAIGGENDIFIPLSTSGCSENILMAVHVAQEKRIKTIAFTGKSGGHLMGQCECMCIPSESTARIQESHIMLGHILCGEIERAIFPVGN
jgi:D-sedoheptulose 7-phosphate isomerase